MRESRLGIMVTCAAAASFAYIPAQAAPYPAGTGQHRDHHDRNKSHHDKRHHSDKGKTAAAVLAGALVIGAVAVAASSKRQDRYQYPDHYRDFRDRPRQWYPARGVTCYRDQRACYKVGRGYSPHWTRREFH
ncbi:hypothetical protein GCM10023219_09980 [Stakelama sediminis]|uniref:Spy/CpxP family protein refolding chaperone n=1 Tax=Stakelama sediminis TaxID=463200 RepID=A0A840YVY1_9SPHN|nr:hypothetical protein [Stakelama sediminis]MBB5717720.1 Spy/CpxP family protein refolding chaperone [Stakelama sediminis]